jgi:hypothetical protein
MVFFRRAAGASIVAAGALASLWACSSFEADEGTSIADATADSPTAPAQEASASDGAIDAGAARPFCEDKAGLVCSDFSDMNLTAGFVQATVQANQRRRHPGRDVVLFRASVVPRRNTRDRHG